jgi:hypothetical protein
MFCGLYYKHIMIVNDDSIMTLQVVASPTIVILTTLEVSFMLLAKIYSRGITHDNRHVTIVIYLLYRTLNFQIELCLWIFGHFLLGDSFG